MIIIIMIIYFFFLILVFIMDLDASAPQLPAARAGKYDVNKGGPYLFGRLEPTRGRGLIIYLFI